mmetsp:Transcript_4849/g.11573  ORF Transcript_4849/g.11573 Transcript_4849/m.11573 type:complete len:526 (-) Transcript_4849:621-2198(-)
MTSDSLYVLACLALVALSNHACHAFYLPGVNPQSFADGESVKLKVNKMTSSQTLLPVEYYKLPFCQPPEGAKMDNENLGEFLAGDRIESSPYVLNMKKEVYCQQVCVADLGKAEQAGMKKNKVVRAINHGYHNNWIVDNLSAASIVEDDTSVTTRYWQGFPIGFIHEETQKAYIHNHVNIEIMYHPVDKITNDEEQKYRVVRFTVEPFSVKHEYQELPPDITADHDTSELQDDVKIINPIKSCDDTIPKSDREHTTYDMVIGPGVKLQPASGDALFTYDVTWIENDELHWASRWDIYLSMDNAIPAKVHWLSIANSLVIVFVLSAMVFAILLRNLRQDLARYNRLATDEEKADDLEEKGWKLVHADIFRPPTYSPLLFFGVLRNGSSVAVHDLLDDFVLGYGVLVAGATRSSVDGRALVFCPHGIRQRIRHGALVQDLQGQGMAERHSLYGVGIPRPLLWTLLLFGFDCLGIREQRCRSVHDHAGADCPLVWNLDASRLCRSLFWIQGGRDRVPRQDLEHSAPDS